MTPHAETIKTLETRFWQSMVEKDADTAVAMLADEFFVANSGGTMRINPRQYGEMTREGGWHLDRFEFSDLDVIFPNDDVAVIAYTVHQTGEMKGEKMDLRCADSTTWVKHDGEWKCSIHTETVLGKMPMTN